MQAHVETETMEVKGGELIDRIKAFIHEGNVRRVVIKQGEQTIVEFPLTLGVVGAVLAPMLAAVGAVAALVTECTIEVERETEVVALPRPDGARLWQSRGPSHAAPRTFLAFDPVCIKAMKHLFISSGRVRTMFRTRCCNRGGSQ